jgi:hypothetical protein
MLRQKSLLVSLVLLVERLSWLSEPAKRARGRPKTYFERLILTTLVIMIIRRLSTPYGSLAFLNQDDPWPRQLHPLLHEHGCCPSRRRWERRQAALPMSLSGMMGYVGRHLVAQLQLWARHGRDVALDSTPLETDRGVWHQHHRE